MAKPPISALRLRLARASSGLRVLMGGRPGSRGALVFAYHDIGDEPRDTTDYYLSAVLLRRQLEMGRRAGLRFVPLLELTRAVLAGESVDSMASVTFDDALAGVHHYALPVLSELAVPSTVFVVTEELGRIPPWWNGAGRTMTPTELREVADAGVTVAAHSRHHPSLVGLPSVELEDEVRGSRSQLEDLVASPVDIFAYPFGHHDSAVRETASEAGFIAGYTFLNGRIVRGLDPFRLPRLTMSARQGRARFAYQLARSPEAWPDSQADRVVDKRVDV